MYYRKSQNIKKESNNQYHFKSIALTAVLVFILIFSIYLFIAIFISGPNNKYENEHNQIVEKIKRKEEDIERVTKHSFKYVTYTCISKDKYTIYDKNAKKIATRDKSELKLDEVKEIIAEKYSSLQDVEIEIGYGKKNIAYVIEKDKTLLILDFDSLKKVFYMKEEL